MANTKVRKPWQSGQYTVYLWEFLLGLLQDPECCSLITWTDKKNKEFRIINTHEIATLWGAVKNRPTMNDKKLLRALRYYYKTKILRKVKGHKAVYQFLSIPYETEGCDEQEKSSPKSSTLNLVDSPEHSITDTFSALEAECSPRITNCCGTPENCLKNTGKEEAKDNKLEETNGYRRSRALCSDRSEYSISSDSSAKSLDLFIENMSENMDVVFDEISNVRTYNDVDFFCLD